MQIFDELTLRHRNKLVSIIGLLAGTAISIVVFLNYFDAPGYLPDDGGYAYVANEIVKGAVLHKDVQDVHAGYINFLNALAIAIFGVSFASIRIPLFIPFIGLVLVCGCFFARLRPVDSLVAGFVMAATSVIFFVNPTANWYCLLLALWAGVVVSSLETLSAKNLALLGLIAGTTFFFRQISGVVLSAGILLALTPHLVARKKSTSFFGTVIVGLPVLSVLVFSIFKANTVGTLVLFLFWPVLISLRVLCSAKIAASTSYWSLWWFGVGALVAGMPIFAYHALNGSLSIWVYDTVLRAAALSGTAFTKDIAFSDYPIMILEGVLNEPTSKTLLNAFYWATALVAPFLLGVLIWKQISLKRNFDLLGFPIVAILYSLISLHYQVPIYLMYSTSFTLVAILYILYTRGALTIWLGRGGLLLVSMVGVLYQGGQPAVRSFHEIFGGKTVSKSSKCDLQRLNLRVSQQDCERYRFLVSYIDANSHPSDPILVLPASPEIYFLSNRQSAFRFYNTALGLGTATDVYRAIDVVTRTRPPIILVDKNDKYFNFRLQTVLDGVLEIYEVKGTFHGFEVYQILSSDHRADL